MTDVFGRELVVGDQVAHASRSGSSVYVSLLEVVGFTERKALWGTKTEPVALCMRLRSTGYYSTRTPQAKPCQYTSQYLVKLERV